MSYRTETIGKAESCDIVFPPSPGLLDHHGTMVRGSGRIFFRPRGSEKATRLNGDAITSKQWHEIAKGDRLRLGTLEIEVGQRLFGGQARTRILASDLVRRSRSGKLLCGIDSLRFLPGELVGVMGPSGAGKSVLLEMLSGTVKPDEGAVWLEDSEGSQRAATPAGGVGFVPQKDQLHSDLTVFQSLDLRLRLQFPDMSPRIRQILIQESCLSLGLGSDQPENFLLRRIGGKEDRQRGALSGGERRRVAIAHELVGQSSVLLLDEPTSGLSSVEAELVVRLLCEISRKKEMPVITSLHQPGKEVFAALDRLVLIGAGGRLLYDGDASEAAERIAGISGKPSAGRDAAEYVVAAAADNEAAEKLNRRKESSQGAQKPKSPAERESTPSPLQPKNPLAQDPFSRFVSRFSTLSLRSFLLLFANRSNAWLMAAQAAGIGALMLLALANYHEDDPAQREFILTAFHFQELKQPFEEQSRAIPVDQLMREAEQRAEADGKSFEALDPGTARKRASVYFLLASAAVWFGLIASCREVVSELVTLGIDLRAGRHKVVSYVIAKWFVVSLFSGIGVVVLVAAVAPLLLDASFSQTAKLVGILWLTCSAAVGLGLIVSAISRSSRIALTIVPLLVLPQLLFSGFLRPIGTGGPESESVDLVTKGQNAIAAVTLQRWAFAALLQTDRFADTGVLNYHYNSDGAGRYAKLNRVDVFETGIETLFFPSTADNRNPSFVIALWICLFLATTSLVIHTRCRRRIAM